MEIAQSFNTRYDKDHHKNIMQKNGMKTKPQCAYIPIATLECISPVPKLQRPHEFLGPPVPLSLTRSFWERDRICTSSVILLGESEQINKTEVNAVDFEKRMYSQLQKTYCLKDKVCNTINC